MLWSSVVEIVRGSLFVLAHWCGGSFGTAIIVASVGIRVAMLPVTLAAARRWPPRDSAKSGTFDRRTVLQSLVQFPPAAALYSAIRGAAFPPGGFLWIANLATPDRAIAIVAAVVTATLTWTSAGAGGSGIAPAAVSAVVTFLILAHFSAGLVVYSITGSLVAAGERRIVSRRRLAARR
jgi:membrane protein insertase Oxa1/YidC/SpoIIIJ